MTRRWLIFIVFTLPWLAAISQNNSLLVGRQTGWEPTDVANLTLWLRADQEVYQDAGKTTPTTASNDPIHVWGDLSGNGNDFTSIGDSDPIYRIAESFNGNPSVYFLGSNLDTEGMEASSSLFPATGDFTAYVVCVSDGGLSSGPRTAFGQYNDTSSGRMQIAYNTSIGDSIYIFINGSTSVFNTYPPSAATAAIYTLVRSGNDFSYYKNGVFLGTDTVSGITITTAVNTSIGFGYSALTTMRYFWNGRIAEAGLWSAALSNADLDDLHEYLTIRYFNN